MGRQQSDKMETITSLDGTRTITVEEFDKMFDDASDEIDDFVDWSKGKMVGPALDVPVGRPQTTRGQKKIRPAPPRDAAE